MLVLPVVQPTPLVGQAQVQAQTAQGRVGMAKRREALGIPLALRLEQGFLQIQGWVNHVRYADTWGLRKAVFARLAKPPKH